jgi:hypothetical protein
MEDSWRWREFYGQIAQVTYWPSPSSPRSPGDTCASVTRGVFGGTIARQYQAARDLGTFQRLTSTYPCLRTS